MANNFQIELARNPQEWAKGLSGRSQLAESHGLFFVYPSSEPRSFWMKGMVFPIDIIYINEDEMVVKVERNVPPMEEHDDLRFYPSGLPIKYALEVNAGESSNIKTGDSCKLNFNNDISRYILTFN